MKFYTDKTEQYLIFKLEEEKLGVKVAPALKSELVFIVAEGNRNIIFDLSSVKELDTDGLDALLMGHRLCIEKGGIMVFTGDCPAFVNLAKVSHTIENLNILPTVEESIEAVFLNEIEAELKVEGGEEE
jgi:anti-anti-sigma regulatory factor